MRLLLFLLSAVLVSVFSFCCAKTVRTESDSNAITPPDSLPLFPQVLQVPAQFQTGEFATPHTVMLPQGFTISVFATGITGARFMCWSPDSTLYVCAMDANQVIALPDHNGDGIADSTIVIVSGLNHNHSCEFYHDTLYVAQTDRVTKMIPSSYSRTVQTQQDIVTGILTGGSHTTRTIVFDAPNKKMYLSVGSSCNICNDPPQRACILRFNDDGTGEETFASGLRNSVGLDFQPITHQLWANNNGFDEDGNDLPPEAINIIEEGKFYGWPLAYGDKQFNTEYYSLVGPMTHADTLQVLGMQPPVAQVQAHSAPLGLYFYTGSGLPSDYTNQALMCYHGSWNRSPATGYKVVRLRGNPDGTNMRVADFLTGFMTDSIPSSVYWGRPVGITADARGNIYISDDYANAIYRIHYTATTNVKERGEINDNNDIHLLGEYPDPATKSTTLKFMAGQNSHVQIDIIDERGAVVRDAFSMNAQQGENQISLDTSSLPDGVYFARISGVNTKTSAMFRVAR